jgi:hypothetical protein
MNLGGPQAQISAFRQPAVRGRVAELTEWFDVVARTNVRSASRWPAFATALAEAHAGDATKFATKPVFPPDPSAMRIAICGDFPYPGDFRSVRALERSLREVAPRLGWRHAWIFAMNCARLPDNGTYPPHRARFTGVPPILVAAGVHDDNTPPEWGRHVADQLPGARFLTADGDHAVYLDGNPCARTHVHRYLTTGQLPPPNTSCA